MGHIFEAKSWENHPSGCSFDLLWLRKLAKAKEKDLKGKMELLAQLFMKIMEIGRKGRSQVTG